jgi:hypothetical protein
LIRLIIMSRLVVRMLPQILRHKAAEAPATLADPGNTDVGIYILMSFLHALYQLVFPAFLGLLIYHVTTSLLIPLRELH